MPVGHGLHPEVGGQQSNAVSVPLPLSCIIYTGAGKLVRIAPLVVYSYRMLLEFGIKEKKTITCNCFSLN